MRSRKTWLRVVLPVLTILWIGFILSRSMKPANASHVESKYYLTQLRMLIPGVSMFLVRKAAHFVEFFVLGLLLFWDVSLLWRRCVPISAGAGLLVAAADELLQRTVPGRSGELTDVLLDFCGVITACLLAWGIAKIREKKRGNKHE